jgi:hypothetical protein
MPANSVTFMLKPFVVIARAPNGPLMVRGAIGETSEQALLNVAHVLNGSGHGDTVLIDAITREDVAAINRVFSLVGRTISEYNHSQAAIAEANLAVVVEASAAAPK